MICTICMDVINEGDEVQQLPCGHKLHSVCASEWRRTARISNLFQCPMGCHRSAQTESGLGSNVDRQPSEVWEQMPVEEVG